MVAEAELVRVWAVAGSYFEACNCAAICPCRRVGERAGGRSTYGICQFALSWRIGQGHAGEHRLDDLAVVVAGWYDDDEPGNPWRVSLYLDERASGDQPAVRRAGIELSHVPRRWAMRAETYLTVRAETPVQASAPVACGIPSWDRPGQEVIAGTFRVDDAPLSWALHGRCGFATDFAYSSGD